MRFKQANKRSRSNKKVTTNALMKFANLPPELRCKIYSYILPDGWWCEYKVQPESGLVGQTRRRRDQSTGEDRYANTIETYPSLFKAAKWIFHEAMEALLRACCQIRISTNGIVTNFPLECAEIPWSRNIKDRVREGLIRLPPCQTVCISVVRPSPQVSSTLLQVRCNVAKVVTWLDSCALEKSPRLEMSLVSGPNENETPCFYSDLAILLGPFSKLHRRYASVAVSRGRNQQPYDAAIEQQCHRLEKALNGDGREVERVLEYQQAIIDIRLPVSHLNWMLTNGLRASVDGGEKDWYAPFQAGAWCVSHILAGIERLQTWCSRHNEIPPSWLSRLEFVIGSPRIHDHRAVVQLFAEAVDTGHHQIGSFENWATGCLPRVDPFWYRKAS